MERVTLVPDRRRAAVWTALGLLAVVLAAYAFGSSQDVVWTGLLVAACAVPTGVFGLQLLAPEAWTLQVDRRGVHGHVGTFHVEEDFSDLRAVELRHRAGEDLLVLVAPASRRALWLPIGCDLTALRELLRDIEHAKARGL